jgi:hypothetical protein
LKSIPHFCPHSQRLVRASCILFLPSSMATVWPSFVLSGNFRSRNILTYLLLGV